MSRISEQLAHKIYNLLKDSPLTLTELCMNHPDMPTVSQMWTIKKENPWFADMLDDVDKYKALRLESDAIVISDDGEADGYTGYKSVRRSALQVQTRLTIASNLRKSADKSKIADLQSVTETLTAEALALREEIKREKTRDY